MLSQILPLPYFGEDAHLLDGDFVQFLQALRLRDAVIDHDGVDVLHVGNADELVDCGVVALVAFERWIGGLLLLVRHTEEGHVQHICLTRVDDVHLRARDRGGNEVLLNGIRVNAIVDLRQLPLCRPADQFLFFRLETLIVRYQIKFELYRYPRRKFKGDVMMSKCTSPVAT